MELGGVPNLMSDSMDDINDKPITLELTNRFANVKGMFLLQVPTSYLTVFC